MKLPVFDTQEQVPGAFRELYEERDGKWQAKEDAAPDPNKLADPGKAALDAERKARKEAEDRAKEAERKAAELEQTQKAQKAGLTDEQLQKLRADVRADIEREYAGKALSELPDTWAARTEGSKALADNRALRLDHQVRALALEKGEVRGERVDAWWKQFGDRFDLTDDGKPMVKAAPGTEVLKYITDVLKKELPDFYKGTQAAGSGAGGIQRDGKLVPGTTADDILKNPTGALQAARESAA